MSEVELQIRYSQRSISSMQDWDKPMADYFSPDQDMLDAIEALLTQGRSSECIISKDHIKIDNGKGRQYQFPTIDHETMTTITMAFGSLAACGVFIKNVTDIL